jgi:hypothetical protein
VQNGDGWIAVQDAFVLGVPQFIDAGLLLASSLLRSIAAVPQYRRRTGFPAQMGDVGGADHDLGRHSRH